MDHSYRLFWTKRIADLRRLSTHMTFMLLIIRWMLHTFSFLLNKFVLPTTDSSAKQQVIVFLACHNWMYIIKRQQKNIPGNDFWSGNLICCIIKTNQSFVLHMKFTLSYSKKSALISLGHMVLLNPWSPTVREWHNIITIAATCKTPLQRKWDIPWHPCPVL